MQEPFVNGENSRKRKDEIEQALKSYSLLNKDPFLDNSFLSKLFFQWGFKVIKLANITALKHEYLGKLRDEGSSKAMLNNLKHHWSKQQSKKELTRSLFMTVVRANIWHITLIVILALFRNTSRILQVASFHYYLQLFKQSSSLSDHAYSVVEVGLFYLFVRIVEVVLIGKTYEYQCYLGFKASAELNCLIYDKLFRLSTNDLSSQSQTGEILNFIQVDSNKLNRAMLYTQDIISLPYSVLMYSYFLLRSIGVSFVFGIVTLLLFFLVNFQFQKQFKIIQRDCMSLKDRRMKVSTETFNIIKMLKLYCWEEEFQRRIIDAHETELKLLKKRFDLTNINQTIATIGPIAVSIVSIGAYQYFNERLNIEDIFSCLNVFSSLAVNIRMFPMILSQFYDTSISMRRVEKFLLQKEINAKGIIRNDQETTRDGIAIQVDNCSFSWGEVLKKDLLAQCGNKSEDNERIVTSKRKNSLRTSLKSSNSFDIKLRFEEPDPCFQCLKNINLTIPKGSFVVILGEVGSGKSSLLQALMNRMSAISSKGRVIVNGSVSFVNQIPWIINNTLRENILLFNEYNEEKYKRIVSLCQLGHDIEGLIGKDLTEVGEKGVNLSGGQKVRINLARALYTNADILFFDDITSALDADIALKIMKKCIMGYLKGKTRLLVTNTVKYASYADYIIYMADGEAVWQGSFDQLKKQEFFEKYCSVHSSSNLSRVSDLSLLTSDEDFNKNKEIKRITKDEMHNESLSNTVFRAFARLIGGWGIIATIGFTMIVIEAFKGASNIWLGYWSKHQDINKNSRYFAYYSLLGFSEAIFFFIYSRISNSSSIKLSRALHDSMIISLINAPLASFHDTIPKGQIINRISKDIHQVDLAGMSSYTTYLGHSITFMASIAICSIYQPFSLLFLPLLVIVGLFLTHFYLKCSRELSHLEAIMRSPIITLTTDTISGLDTIREYDLKEKYMAMFHERVDNHLKVHIAKIGTSQWFNLYLDLLSISFFAFLIFITSTNKASYSIEEIGIIMTYFIPIQVNLVRALYDRTLFETSMVNIERCLEYSKCFKERAKVLPEDKTLIDQRWPSQGKIVFRDFSARYREDSEVILKDISFEIKSKEKIGIVGRTGSGKTTLSLCLFRILEPMKGRICIDGIDISTIGLNLLRRSITIIPQDPLLVEGTLRYNIDPLNLATDEEIIDVMKRIGFDYLLYQNDNGLLQKLDDSGSNISVGEKQLVCIARAILRKSKVIVLDEATASIDYHTEEIILKAMTELFSDSTVIMIAHRIKTIMQCNKVLVINDGCVAEFNTPEVLMRNKTGLFFELYAKSFK